MFGVVAYFCPFVFTQKPPPPAAVIDFLCKARIQNFLINSISVRRAVERDCQTRACSNLTLTPTLDMLCSWMRYFTIFVAAWWLEQAAN